ncbi:MAG: membrane-associated protease 1 [Clostridium sp.]|nr:membrane-associated protease 1 [Clostridium sp.]
MGFQISIEGGSTIDLSVKTIEAVEFLADVPEDSNARSASLATTMVIKGKILTLFEGSEESLALSEWSRVATVDPECYRKVTVKVIAAGQVVRQYVLSKAFVVDYIEEFDDKTGTGTYILVVRQKKDNVDEVEISGGFSA